MYATQKGKRTGKRKVTTKNTRPNIAIISIRKVPVLWERNASSSIMMRIHRQQDFSEGALKGILINSSTSIGLSCWGTCLKKVTEI